MAHQSPPEIAPGRAIGWSFPVHERREPSFQDLAELAASITAHPFAGISLVDVDHVWIKAGVGIEPGRLLRETSFCGHAVTSDLPVFTVPDTTAHPSFRDNPLVTGRRSSAATAPAHWSARTAPPSARSG